MPRSYKDFKIYGCFTLNRLVSELDIDLYQDDLEEKLDRILGPEAPGLSKEDVKHEIMSNHFMTNKVLESLEAEGLIKVEQHDGRYVVKITKEGVLYIRKYNEFFFSLYKDQIHQHYRYRGLPRWARGIGKE